ncbi:lysylphosphatidylglycerol synthase transmembrane domain-containing protein [Azospirillum formosense]|uniref:lysylphosphatidylglycerol synthase transmembrane domain-containing protein n=1 Tax=Azospirillum formosense TaxID=861533 RepID=UPI00338F2C74
MPTDAQTLPAGKSGGRLMLLAKLAVTLAVLGVLGFKADWPSLLARVADAEPVWMAAGFLAKLLAVVFAGERWRDALHAAGERVSRWLAIRLMFTSLFFGQVLPGALGGDVVRGWLTYRGGASSTAVVVALVLDRLLALTGCILLLFLGLPHLVATAPPSVAWAGPAAVFLLALGLVAGLQVDRMPLPDFLMRPPVRAARAQVARLRGALLSRMALVGLAHSAAVHLCTIVAVIAYAHALDIPMRPLDALAVVPMTIFAAALPISLNGWGVREGAFVAGFALYGLGATEALALSLMIGLSVTVSSLPGGPLWFSLKGRREVGRP